ncbi:MAG: outer membrane lipoprotein carrier protein LolA [Nitrospirota bacterium]
MKKLKKEFSRWLRDNLAVMICFCLVLTSIFAVSVIASTVEEDIIKIQKAYENIKDLKGNFVQKSHIKDLNRTDTYTGQFFIKQPCMRWNYDGEAGQEVLINNNEIIIYQKREKQAFRGDFDKDTYGRAPIAILSGFGNIQEEFYVSKKNKKLLLKPKKHMMGILSIELELSKGDFPISSFIINDSYSNKVEIILKDIKINTGLEDRLFTPLFPKDISIYEQNL